MTTAKSASETATSDATKVYLQQMKGTANEKVALYQELVKQSGVIGAYVRGRNTDQAAAYREDMKERAAYVGARSRVIAATQGGVSSANIKSLQADMASLRTAYGKLTAAYSPRAESLVSRALDNARGATGAERARAVWDEVIAKVGDNDPALPEVLSALTNQVGEPPAGIDSNRLQHLRAIAANIDGERTKAYAALGDKGPMSRLGAKSSEEEIRTALGSLNVAAYMPPTMDTPVPSQSVTPAMLDSDPVYQQMEQDRKLLHDELVGGPGTDGETPVVTDSMKEILSRPEFQEWAQDHGFHVGTVERKVEQVPVLDKDGKSVLGADGKPEMKESVTLGAYIPGRDDMRAGRYAVAQMEGKLVLPRRSSRTPALVRLTVTDPTSTDSLKHPDGKYRSIVDPVTGKPVWLTQDQAEALKEAGVDEHGALSGPETAAVADAGGTDAAKTAVQTRADDTKFAFTKPGEGYALLADGSVKWFSFAGAHKGKMLPVGPELQGRVEADLKAAGTKFAPVYGEGKNGAERLTLGSMEQTLETGNLDHLGTDPADFGGLAPKVSVSDTGPDKKTFEVYGQRRPRHPQDPAGSVRVETTGGERLFLKTDHGLEEKKEGPRSQVDGATLISGDLPRATLKHGIDTLLGPAAEKRAREAAGLPPEERAGAETMRHGAEAIVPDAASMARVPASPGRTADQREAEVAAGETRRENVATQQASQADPMQSDAAWAEARQAQARRHALELIQRKHGRITPQPDTAPDAAELGFSPGNENAAAPGVVPSGANPLTPAQQAAAAYVHRGGLDIRTPRQAAQASAEAETTVDESGKRIPLPRKESKEYVRDFVRASRTQTAPAPAPPVVMRSTPADIPTPPEPVRVPKETSFPANVPAPPAPFAERVMDPVSEKRQRENWEKEIGMPAEDAKDTSRAALRALVRAKRQSEAATTEGSAG